MMVKCRGVHERYGEDEAKWQRNWVGSSGAGPALPATCDLWPVVHLQRAPMHRDHNRRQGVNTQNQSLFVIIAPTPRSCWQVRSPRAPAGCRLRRNSSFRSCSESLMPSSFHFLSTCFAYSETGVRTMQRTFSATIPHHVNECTGMATRSHRDRLHLAAAKQLIDIPKPIPCCCRNQPSSGPQGHSPASHR